MEAEPSGALVARRQWTVTVIWLGGVRLGAGADSDDPQVALALGVQHDREVVGALGGGALLRAGQGLPGAVRLLGLNFDDLAGGCLAAR